MATFLVVKWEKRESRVYKLLFIASQVGLWDTQERWHFPKRSSSSLGGVIKLNIRGKRDCHFYM